MRVRRGGWLKINKLNKTTPGPFLSEQYYIELGGRRIPYLLRGSERAKNLNIKIGIETGLEVVAPRNCPLAQVESLLKCKEDWILKNMAAVSRVEQQRKARSLAEKQAVYYLGQAYRLVVVYQQGSPLVELMGDKMIVMLPQSHGDKVKYLLSIWFRNKAREIISQRLELIKRKIKVEYNQVFIKDQKTRWGSCSGEGNLNFNYRLVMAPLPVIDYLVTHELAHLLEMNHSKKFWSLVQSVCPEYKKHRQWLKEHGWQLAL